MTLYSKSNPINENYIYKSQVLSSLVLNPPYKVDGFTTSKKVEKILTLPFGVKVSSRLLLRSAFNFIVLSSVFMIACCLFITCVSLPLQAQNFQLSDNAKNLANKKSVLLAKVNQASSYNKLFLNAELYKMEDSKEIIYVKNTNERNNNIYSKVNQIKKYPSIQFAGF